MFFDRTDTVRITCTEGISRNSENSDIKNVRSDDDQNNNSNSNKSVEELVSELFGNGSADDTDKRSEKNIDRITTTSYGRSIRQPARYDKFVKIGINDSNPAMKTLDKYFMLTKEVHVMK
jgi:hypothetical protein